LGLNLSWSTDSGGAVGDGQGSYGGRGARGVGGFLKHFSDLPDPRQRGKVMYRLDEILLLCLLAVLAGAETIVDIARFGEKKRKLLRRFRPFGDGTPPQASHPCFAGAGPKLASPSHDHLGDILASLDAEAFQRCFVALVGSLTGVAADVIAIDGKTVRRSYQKKGGTASIHMVSAFVARQPLVLGQVKVADKSNEITAIPKLLEMMVIEGATVTINAMGAAGHRSRRLKLGYEPNAYRPCA